jgi:hypothetical protein
MSEKILNTIEEGVLRIGDLELNLNPLFTTFFLSLYCIFLINALRSLFIRGCRFFASIKAGIPINLALPLGVS